MKRFHDLRNGELSARQKKGKKHTRIAFIGFMLVLVVFSQNRKSPQVQVVRVQATMRQPPAMRQWARNRLSLFGRNPARTEAALGPDVLARWRHWRKSSHSAVFTCDCAPFFQNWSDARASFGQKQLGKCDFYRVLPPTRCAVFVLMTAGWIRCGQ